MLPLDIFEDEVCDTPYMGFSSFDRKQQKMTLYIVEAESEKEPEQDPRTDCSS